MTLSDEARPDLAVLLTGIILIGFVLQSAVGLVAFLSTAVLFYYLNK